MVTTSFHPNLVLWYFTIMEIQQLLFTVLVQQVCHKTAQVPDIHNGCLFERLPCSWWLIRKNNCLSSTTILSCTICSCNSFCSEHSLAKVIPDFRSIFLCNLYCIVVSPHNDFIASPVFLFTTTFLLQPVRSKSLSFLVAGILLYSFAYCFISVSSSPPSFVCKLSRLPLLFVFWVVILHQLIFWL